MACELTRLYNKQSMAVFTVVHFTFHTMAGFGIELEVLGVLIPEPILGRPSLRATASSTQGDRTLPSINWGKWRLDAKI